MKKQVITFKFKQQKHRAHKALFDNDLPFGQKIVNPKNQYKRRPKHRSIDWDEVN